MDMNGFRTSPRISQFPPLYARTPLDFCRSRKYDYRMPSIGSVYRPGLFSQFLPCLTPSESRALTAYGTNRSDLVSWRDGLVCRVLLATGIRRAELVQLSRSSVAFHEGEPWLVVSGKGGRIRTVPFPINLLEEVDTLKRAYNTRSGVFLPTRHYKRVTRLSYCGVWRAVHRASTESIGRHVHPHTLRHTAATLMLNSGGSIIGVMAILGHTSIRTTERYLHAIPQAMSDCVNSEYLQTVGLVPRELLSPTAPAGSHSTPSPLSSPPPAFVEAHRGA